MSLSAYVEVRLSTTFRLSLQLDLAGGTTTAIVGKNGAGKTTLMRILAGLRSLDRGHISLYGTTLDDVEKKVFVEPAKRSVGVVFHDGRLFPHMNAVENIAFALRHHGQSRNKAHSNAVDWLRRFGLSAHEGSRPGELSAGQTQRVALARALAPNPQLLLLDEPLAALDERTRVEIRAELAEHLATFEGVRLLITHDKSDALLADSVITLAAGLVVTAAG